MTDGLVLYKGVGGAFDGRHRTVSHSKDEYERRYGAGRHQDAHEHGGGLLLPLKRVYGGHHSVSPRHLHRYVNETGWRYSRRNVDDGARMLEFVRCTEGKKLANRQSAAL